MRSFKPVLFTAFVAAAIGVGCGGSAEDSSQKGNSNANLAIGITPTPASALSITPTPVGDGVMTTAAPGIDPNVKPQEIKPGGTPIPGIPVGKSPEKKVDPNTSPAPGIPSEKEVRRMMNTQQDANVVNRPANVSGQKQ